MKIKARVCTEPNYYCNVILTLHHIHLDPNLEPKLAGIVPETRLRRFQPLRTFTFPTLTIFACSDQRREAGRGRKTSRKILEGVVNYL